MNEPTAKSAGAVTTPAVSAGVLLVFLAAALLSYAPALEAPLFSDDHMYLTENEYVLDPTPEHLAAIVDPRSEVPMRIENYAPVHLLLHAAAWQSFGESLLGHHVLNIALHALASWLLALLFVRSGVQSRIAWLGAAVFLLHPANVEAVAWISQLKSVSALARLVRDLLRAGR